MCESQVQRDADLVRSSYDLNCYHGKAALEMDWVERDFGIEEILRIVGVV